MSSNGLNFSESNQAKEWIFSPERLAELKHHQATSHGLSVQDFNLWVNFYSKKIFDVLTKKELDASKSIPTSLMLFKRYCLVGSFQKFQIQDIAMACCFLGGKIEENRINFDRLAHNFGLPKPDALKLELHILGTLNFHLNLYHPFKPLTGFLYFLEERDSSLLTGQERSSGDLQITKLLFSDVPFLFSPSLIALCVLHRLNPKFSQIIFDLFPKFGSKKDLEPILEKMDFSLELPSSDFISKIESKISLNDDMQIDN